MGSTYKADAVVVGGGLAGLTVALELLDAGRSVVMLERGPEFRSAAYSLSAPRSNVVPVSATAPIWRCVTG